MVNYQMTGRYVIPDTDKEIEAIIDGNPEIFGQIVPDNTHILISVVMAGSTSDAAQEDILYATEDSVSFAEFPPSYNIIVTGDPAFMVSMNYEMNSSMGVLLGLSGLFMVIILFFVFKHVRWGPSPSTGSPSRNYLHLWSYGLYRNFPFHGLNGCVPDPHRRGDRLCYPVP